VEELIMVFKIMIDDQPHEIDIVHRRPHLIVRIDGREHEISTVGNCGNGRQIIEIAGIPVHFARAHSGDQQSIRLNGRNFEARILDPQSENSRSGSTYDNVKAPMPGAVILVHKMIGDTVTRGESIVTIESMKLQTALPAPRDGVIAEILRTEGETFQKNEVIARLVAIQEG
jgi:biotin carboxyl carrier protein